MDEETVLSTHGLTRRFGDLVAVDAVDLRVPKGAVYGFLGPNGAGKTTTIRLILGLLRPGAGEVRVFGTSLSGSRRQVLARVGSLVEGPSLYPHLTGRENLRIAAILRGLGPASVDRALSEVGLSGAAGRLVKGYSLGMRQRLGLALALLPDPDLLVLDEPTNGLDPAGILEVRRLLAALAGEKGRTVFLSSHLLSEVEQVATHVGVVARGRLLFEGTLGELSGRRLPSVVVAVDHRDLALELLAGAGLPARVRADGLLVVDAGPAEAAHVNALLVRHRIAVTRLLVETPALEESFLALTAAGEEKAA